MNGLDQIKMTRKPSKPTRREYTDTDLIAIMHDKHGDDLARKDAYRLKAPTRPGDCNLRDAVRDKHGNWVAPTRKVHTARKPQPPVNRPFACLSGPVVRS